MEINPSFNPTLSVIMPVWNGDKYLAKAVDSILNQSLRDFEFLIIDDGSTDTTPAILTRYAEKDSRIRIIQLSHDGIVIALNRGIEEARSKWIARMDCDDIAHPERFQQQMKQLAQNKSAILSHTAVRQIGDSRYFTSQQRIPRSKAFYALRLCYGPPIIHPTVIFSKEAFHLAGGYRTGERHAEDYSLWGRMLPLGEFSYVHRPLLDFRVHTASISKQKAGAQSVLAGKIARKHCQEFMSLSHQGAARAQVAIGKSRLGSNLSEWFWFLACCLPRMQWQSIELWAWAIFQTLKRMK
ncbi:MAG: glycosyltransferase [Verrucomicrobiota bacterium]